MHSITRGVGLGGGRACQQLKRNDSTVTEHPCVGDKQEIMWEDAFFYDLNTWHVKQNITGQGFKDVWVASAPPF